MQIFNMHKVKLAWIGGAGSSHVARWSVNSWYWVGIWDEIL